MKRYQQSGFTLIEMLLSISIVSALILSVSFFFITMFESRVNNQMVSEVEGQAMIVMNQLLQTARNSTDITSPTIGATGTSLTLAVVDAAKTPTVFDLASGAVQIKEGTAAAIPLTSSKVTVTSFSAQNLSATGSAGTVQIQFTLTTTSTSGRHEYNYQKIVTGSASLRL